MIFIQLYLAETWNPSYGNADIFDVYVIGKSAKISTLPELNYTNDFGFGRFMVLVEKKKTNKGVNVQINILISSFIFLFNWNKLKIKKKKN